MDGTLVTALADWVTDARRCTLALVEGLDDEQLMGPRLGIVNPLLWEIGHVAWFQEKWVLRHALGHAPLREDADTMYDSAAVGHDIRWELSLPTREATLRYAAAVRDRILESLVGSGGQPMPDARAAAQRLAYFVKLAVFHEDMHAEAFAYTRQTLQYPRPPMGDTPAASPAPEGAAMGAHASGGDVFIPGGVFALGAVEGEEAFVFDNEKWAHPVEIASFAISACAVTQAEFAEFVDDGGYRRPELWTDAGWRWRQSADAEHPVYWRRDAGGWHRRVFDQWRPLEPRLPVVHVNYHEAQAYCRWAGRRLPTEAEWELAASGSPDHQGKSIAATRRRFPWGDDLPTPATANLDWHWGGGVDVAALPAGESPFGCRQMIGNVWEWTASDFQPYPGFVADPYKEYSQPWFGTHKVLRGGCWATRARLLRNTWRNFYTPDRRDVWAGFRTCENR